jgi:hypothetical protein
MRDKQEKFRELAENRVNRTLNDIRLIGNLANRNNYDYSEDEAQKIIAVLELEIKALKTKFSAEIQKRRQFKL